MRPLLVREIAADHDRAPRLVGHAIVLRALIALPMLLLIALVMRVVPLDHQTKEAVYLGWGMCIFYLLYEPIQAAFQAFERMRYLAYADMVTKSGVSVLAVGLVLLGVHALGLLLASIAIMGGVLLLNAGWARRHLSIDWRTSSRGLAAMFRDSLPYWSFALFFTVYLWIDSLMLAAMTSTTELGWYAMPTKLFGTLMFIPVILSTAWLPRLVRAFTADHDGFWRAARLPIEVVLALSLPVSAGTVLIAGPLIRAFYGHGFDGSIPVLVVLALCVPPMYLNIMFNQVLVAAGRQMAYTKVMVLASIVNPLLNAGLIPYFERTRHNGAVGAGVALLLTEILLSGIGAVMVRRALRESAVVRLVRTLAATAGMTVAVLLARRLGLVAEVLVGTVTFPVLALAVGVLSREESAELRRLAGPTVSRLRPRARAA
jgi:O-antigen/teichoic acid export membrane protein